MRTGKLSREDYEAVDAQLRAEAIEMLDRLQALERAEAMRAATRRRRGRGRAAEAPSRDADQVTS